MSSFLQRVVVPIIHGSQKRFSSISIDLDRRCWLFPSLRCGVMRYLRFSGGAQVVGVTYDARVPFLQMQAQQRQILSSKRAKTLLYISKSSVECLMLRNSPPLPLDPGCKRLLPVLDEFFQTPRFYCKVQSWILVNDGEAKYEVLVI